MGDKVLLYNSHLKMYLGKLKSKWSSPNIVKTVYPYGDVEIIDRNRFNFKVNGQRLMKYSVDWSIRRIHLTNIAYLTSDPYLGLFSTGIDTAYPGNLAGKEIDEVDEVSIIWNHIPQVISAAKLPILNPNEFDLWKMRMEQYFLMIDYSLWEVILNGNPPAPTRVIEGVLHPVAPTMAEQSLKIYEAEVKSSSSASTTTQNIAFVSSSNTDNTNEPVSTAASVSAVSAKIHVSSLPNVDSLRRNLKANGPTSMCFDMSKVECYNCHRKRQFARECRSLKDTRRNATTRVFKQKRSLPTMLFWPSHLQVLLLTMRYQSGNGYYVVPPPYTRTFMPPKPDLVFNNAPNDVETDHSPFNVKLSPTKPDQDLSHTYRPSTPIIEDWVSDSEDESETKPPQNVSSIVQPTEQVKSPRHSVSHVEASILAATPNPASPKHTSNGKKRNRKACFVCKSLDHLIRDCGYHDKKMAQPTARNHAHRGIHKKYALMTHQNPHRHVVPAAVLTPSKPVPITAVRPVNTAVPKTSVTRPKQVKPIVTKPKAPIRRHINRSPSPKASNSPPKVTAVMAPVVNAAQGSQGKWEWKPKCLILDHVFCNTSASITLKRFDYNDAFGRSKSMCDKKNSVLFTNTECLVLSPDFKLPNESQVLLRVPRENNMYNVNLKNIVPSGDLT
nr:hypothetical protein [Tanacetum cinerariifolium]